LSSYHESISVKKAAKARIIRTGLLYLAQGQREGAKNRPTTGLHVLQVLPGNTIAATDEWYLHLFTKNAGPELGQPKFRKK
jgi:hypothetical protein